MVNPVEHGIVTLYAVWSRRVGDIAYSDGSCTTFDNIKTPIGVVFKVDDEGKNGLIVHIMSHPKFNGMRQTRISVA